MKCRLFGLRARVLIAGVLSFILGLSSSVGSARELVVATLNYEPYYGEAMLKDGVVGEITRAVIQAAGHEVRFWYLPWSRALDAIKTGNADVLMSVWYREDRAEYLLYTYPVMENELVFFREWGSGAAFRDWESLRQYRIGGVRDYTYPQKLLELKIEFANTDVQNLRKLARGRVDLAVMDRALAHYVLEHRASDLRSQVVEVLPPIATKEQHLGVSRNIPDAEAILADLNRGIKAIKESGRYQAIRARYGY